MPGSPYAGPNRPFGRVLTALVTPFDPRGEVDLAKAQAHGVKPGDVRRIASTYMAGEEVGDDGAATDEWSPFLAANGRARDLPSLKASDAAILNDISLESTA